MNLPDSSLVCRSAHTHTHTHTDLDRNNLETINLMFLFVGLSETGRNHPTTVLSLFKVSERHGILSINLRAMRYRSHSLAKQE